MTDDDFKAARGPACFPGMCMRRELRARCDGLERDKSGLIEQRDAAVARAERAEAALRSVLFAFPHVFHGTAACNECAIVAAARAVLAGGDAPTVIRCRTCMDSRFVIDHARSSVAAMVRVPCPDCVLTPTGPYAPKCAKCGRPLRDIGNDIGFYCDDADCSAGGRTVR